MTSGERGEIPSGEDPVRVNCELRTCPTGQYWGTLNIDEFLAYAGPRSPAFD